ncbi:Agamous-like MADS-box protein AGL61 [Platanthera guangdongensis]|uniref:Agamous-like MADS-box protein AGL61 n=1 Tax=Platanthera guangdongensis TaxID=2320717 RepID=A0ABR2LDD8_9ASPA
MTNRGRGKGRKKIEIKPIMEVERRQVCFSKRRQGLFAKANELCILCGTEVAILFFSPSGKLYTYGHPSVENVVGRFLNGAAADNPSKATPPTAAASDGHCNDDIKMNLAYWSDCLEKEKRRRSQLKEALKEPWPINIPKPFWWDADVCSMGMPELIEYQMILQQQQHSVALAGKLLSLQQELAAEIGVELAGVVEPGGSCRNAWC